MLITAINAQTAQGSSIVYIPEGISTITPTVNGKPKTVTVKLDAAKGEDIARKFQTQLERRLQANVRPTFDFDHKDAGPASALPKRFYYEAGQGLMAELEWTGAGKAAIESKDYSYFSPTFLIDESGIPAGIPERGPLGALVNEPAFREIPRIAAKDAASTTKEPAMSKLIFAALNVNASAEDAESAALTEIEKLKKMKSEVDAKLAEAMGKYEAMNKKLDAANAEIQKAKDTEADTLVKAAIADGRIAAKDEDTQSFWKSSLISNREATVKALDALPKKAEGIETPVIKASGEKVSDAKGGLIAEADALVKAGAYPTQEEAIGHVATEKPELYEAYRNSIGE